MDWDKLRVFHAVAEAGSFTHAGEQLNLSQSAVSRQISALEESLSVPLFHRHARGLILTEQGELLYRTARDVFSKLAMTEARLADTRESPSGPLKVTTTVAFGTLWLTPRIHGFLERYPDIQVSLVVDDGELDLAMREADVAIRMPPPRQPDLVQRHLMTLHWKVYASPRLPRRSSARRTKVEDLDNHRLMVFGEDATTAGGQRQLAARRRRAAGKAAPPGARRSTMSTASSAPARAGSASPPCPTISAARRTIWCRSCPS